MTTPSLDLLFPAHIAELRSRTDRALAAAGFDGVVFQSGEPLGLARDDQHYPYKAHPYFKWWAPLADAAGSLIHYRAGFRPRPILFVATPFWDQPGGVPVGAGARRGPSRRPGAGGGARGGGGRRGGVGRGPVRPGRPRAPGRRRSGGRRCTGPIAPRVLRRGAGRCRLRPLCPRPPCGTGHPTGAAAFPPSPRPSRAGALPAAPRCRATRCGRDRHRSRMLRCSTTAPLQ